MAVQRGARDMVKKYKTAFKSSNKVNKIVQTNLFSVNFIKSKAVEGGKKSCVIGFTRLRRL